MRQKFVTIVEFSHVIELLDRHASPAIVDAALKAINIDRTLQSVSSGFVPYAAEAALLETVARAIGDRHLGARVGRGDVLGVVDSPFGDNEVVVVAPATAEASPGLSSPQAARSRHAAASHDP